MDTPLHEQLRIPVPSRYGPSEIDGHVLHPAGTPLAVLTIHPATATPERFYFSFAEAAAARGFIVLTYGLRGVGDRAEARAHRRVRMRDWMAEDMPAAAQWAATAFPDLPHVAMGHSIGGHALVQGYGGEALAGIVTVASHRASTRDIVSRSERLRVGLGLGGLGTLATRVLGYMPGRALGLGEDIPQAALFEWTRWLRLPEYFFDDPTLGAGARVARLATPVFAVGASDDPWADPVQIDELVDRLRLAPVTRRTFTPTELGVERIGHHGLLRRSLGQAAWPEILDWLETAASGPH